MTYHNHLETPIGPLTTEVDELRRVRAVHFGNSVPPGSRLSPAHTAEVDRQLGQYFDGTRTVFDLELAPRGSDFQKQVWLELVKVPYGETCTYLDIARRLGCPGGSRAVGRANATNPIAVVVPCHRVIGSHGSLTGYAGGLSIKERLLQLEGARPAGLFA